MSAKAICIIGAGISGLSCAVRLQEVLGKDCQITIYSDKFLTETTSHVAAGVFIPYSEPTIAGYNGTRANPGR